MIRLTQAIVAVMASTVASGFAGGVVGATIGRFAPSFVTWLHSPQFHPPPLQPRGVVMVNFDPTEFGFGLGVVSGLLMGAGTGLFLVVVLTLRDAWLARGGVSFAKQEREPVYD
ncbi:hypothetical protein SAMN05444166_3966 [Singulisphaera sp. GP187]|uniref:hypothetical protein n=1 Tax=Singulisphaera sp. GP187 TaxID=1882752 RepID=UPI00092AFDFD|nr:hypothetical protein [Singulisphaera sp. GP187]SIO34656.1 hypothetical protein SAMN05444166_3966 [Singulisphaera sp. GP187]